MTISPRWMAFVLMSVASLGMAIGCYFNQPPGPNGASQAKAAGQEKPKEAGKPVRILIERAPLAEAEAKEFVKFQARRTVNADGRISYSLGLEVPGRTLGLLSEENVSDLLAFAKKVEERKAALKPELPVGMSMICWQTVGEDDNFIEIDYDPATAQWSLGLSSNLDGLVSRLEHTVKSFAALKTAKPRAPW